MESTGPGARRDVTIPPPLSTKLDIPFSTAAAVLATQD